jgi:hypothetical protein
MRRNNPCEYSSGIEITARAQSAPPFVHADADFVEICLPNEATIAQLARVVVKWLREHPERLHELKSFLVMEALKTNFHAEPGTRMTPTQNLNARLWGLPRTNRPGICHAPRNFVCLSVESIRSATRRICTESRSSLKNWKDPHRK